VRALLGQFAPAQESRISPPMVIARAGGQFVAVGQLQRGRGQRQAGAPGVLVHLFQRLGAEPALGLVVDPLERQIVCGWAIRRR
jgi:hypothetical protein